ncbi:MAG: glycosyltransferase family 2 protein [Desulfurococcus sp.]|uniref:glycosyltransferase family 2 protein n=1 Tax=Desulfurococcus sp. TaxID=51678 RepID=UPI003160F168
MTLRLIREPVRRGKAFALNEALKQASGEIVVITDADSKWLRGDTLKKVAVYLGSPDIGAVSCVKIPEASGPGGVEESYRDFYNVLRVAESNLHSTPVFHGELAAFKRRVLEEVGGFPTDIGADDSHTATLIALKGYRAIMPRDIVCIEAVPERGYSMWRVRRAQHLIQHFWKILKQGLRTPKQFKLTLYTEAYLHLINPWILVVASILLLASTIARGLLALLLLITGLFLLAYKPYRAWITLQLYLIIAALRNLWTKEIVWEKQMKNQH